MHPESLNRGTAGRVRGAASISPRWNAASRVPFMIRWPGKVPAGHVSNEIVHGVELFAMLAKIAGAKVPNDR